MSGPEVRWARRALDDFDQALGYLARKDERIADGYLRAVQEAVAGLSKRNTGRIGRVAGSFEKSLRRYSYVLAYMYEGEVLHVLRIVHTSRDWPQGKWPK